MINLILKLLGIKISRISKPWDKLFKDAIRKSKKTSENPNKYICESWLGDWETEKRKVFSFQEYIKPGDVVCEIGPGLGRMTERYIQCVKKAYLVDYSDVVYKFWKDKNNPKIVSIKVSNCRIPQIPDNFVDVAISLETFLHLNIEEFYFYLKEIHRILKCNGIAVINYLGLNSKEDLVWFKEAVSGCPTKFDFKPSIFKFFHPESIKILSQDIGFSFEDFKDNDFSKGIRHICLLKKTRIG